MNNDQFIEFRRRLAFLLIITYLVGGVSATMIMLAIQTLYHHG